MRRTREADPAEALVRAKQNPKDIEAQCAAADAALAAGDPDTAIALLLAAVAGLLRRGTGPGAQAAARLLRAARPAGPAGRTGPARLTSLLF